jgi:tRNA threonylcarbamoyladenosine modification (KEOPS) complex  Pcc1 subunit
LTANHSFYFNVPTLRQWRRWRVVLLRNKGEILGEVEASDVASAKAAAADRFDLDKVRRNRIIVQELG